MNQRYWAIVSKADIQEILFDYSDWLYKRGYVDSDIWSEEPKAVDEYLKEKTTK